MKLLMNVLLYAFVLYKGLFSLSSTALAANEFPSCQDKKLVYLVNENIAIYDDDTWHWEWIATDQNSAIGYNINFKAMKDGTYSAGNNYYTNGFRVDEVSWTGSGNALQRRRQ